MKLKLLLRFIYINYILVKFKLDKAILRAKKLGPLRFVIYLNPLHWLFRDKRSRGQRLRLALEALGPIYVKFGQILSVRYDLLPEDLIEELSKLQDQVPPFSGDKAYDLVEKAYKGHFHQYFQYFDKTPLASASIAQVHRARLQSGEDVVVKILRPDIHYLIKEDIALLYMLAGMLQRLWTASKRAKPKEVVAEFERTIYDELDLVHEGANASQLRRNFLDYEALYIPKVYWPYVRQNILVMEYVQGLSVRDTNQLKRYNTNLKKLAEQGVEIFFTQVFRDCFFHADLHPGNLMVDVSQPESPKYYAMDFGIMGALSPNDQQYLAENMIAFFRRDYRQVAQLHIDSGWVDPNTRIEEFEATIRTVCEPIFERPLSEISFGHLLAKLFRTAKRFNMEVQPQLLLLQKTLLNVESLGRRLYPELNLWRTAKPFLEKWISQQRGMRYVYHQAYHRGPYWLKQFADMPDMLYRYLSQSQALVQQRYTANMHQNLTEKSLKGGRHKPVATILGASGLALLAYGILDRGVDLHWQLPKGDWALIAAGGLLIAGLLTKLKS